MKPEKLKRALIERAEKLGFDVIRITNADAIPMASGKLREWLSENHHGSMTWMEETEDRRHTPKALWSDVKSIVMLGMNYGPKEDPLAYVNQPDRGSISVYARSRDYHDILKGKLKEVAGLLATRGGGDVKVFVDTAPVMEKPLAQAAGLGWQGKHSVLVSREFGNWLFLGSIFTTIELPCDEPEVDHCGSCRRCLDVCPTDAFTGPGNLDSRRCISYLTIELKEHIPEEFREAIGNRIFGCDDCVAICPWNKFARQSSEIKLAQKDDLAGPALTDLLALDDQMFRDHFSGTPVRRLGHTRFMRNVLIAAGNSRNPELAPQVINLLSDDKPMIRAMSVWALARLLDTEDLFRLKENHYPQETDSDVRLEWEKALERNTRVRQ